MVAFNKPRKLSPFPSLAVLRSVGQWKDNPFRQRQLWGGLCVILGFLLSPLCWWNDLIFNLPIAYGFGYLCELGVKGGLMPGAIAGYWLSNVVGLVLMQAGTHQVWQAADAKPNFKQALWSGTLSSTAFTVLVCLLVHWQILDLSSFSPTELLAPIQNP
ncbi:MAG: hypothetical protein VKL20_05975 [Synechocystis sp.]|nr:hypothetical protein [Synechocystis sp.]